MTAPVRYIAAYFIVFSDFAKNSAGSPASKNASRHDPARLLHERPRPLRPSRFACADALGRGGHRWRRHRPGHGGGRGLARFPHAAGGGGRFRQGHLQPRHQAGARRRALPGPGQYLAGARSPARTRAASPQRAAPGLAAGLRGAGLSPRRSTLLRHRPEDLRPARGPAQPQAQPLAVARPGPGARAHPGPAAKRPRAARRHPVLRRSVRRCAPGHRADAHLAGPGRHGGQLRPRARPGPGRRPHRRRRTGRRGKRRRSGQRPRALRGQRRGRLGRRGAPHGRARCARHGGAQPGGAPDAAARLPAGR